VTSNEGAGLGFTFWIPRLWVPRVDLKNRVVWIPDSKTPNGVAEVPLTELAVGAFRDQIRLSGDGPDLFPSELGTAGQLTTFKTAWRATLRRAKVPYFRIYDAFGPMPRD
jgi:integrase